MLNLAHTTDTNHTPSTHISSVETTHLYSIGFHKQGSVEI